jgi:hypothetical protein
LSLSLSFAIPALAERDPYSATGKYVQELVDLDNEQLKALPIEEADVLFEKAYSVQANDYTEDEIRRGLEGLAFALKFQKAMDEIKAAETQQQSFMSVNPMSVKDGVSYSGDVGVAWTRDITSGHSPLTLSETLSGTYTLEVDYITWDTVATILAASASFDGYSDLKQQVAVGTSSSILSGIICSALGITGGPATVASIAVGAVVGLGWDWLKSIDRSRMYDSFKTMNKKDKNQYMKVEFMYSNRTVNKFYSIISKTSSISNPFPGMYGDWRKDKFGYLYSY